MKMTLTEKAKELLKIVLTYHHDSIKRFSFTDGGTVAIISNAKPDSNLLPNPEILTIVDISEIEKILSQDNVDGADAILECWEYIASAMKDSFEQWWKDYAKWGEIFSKYPDATPLNWKNFQENS